MGILDAPRFELVPLPGALAEARVLPRGSTVTVTASPARGLDATVSLAETLAEVGHHTVPHLSARQIQDEAELAMIVKRLQYAGVTEVFVVGGDAGRPAGAFPDGLTLLRALDGLRTRFQRVGVPAYPEGHPAIPREVLWSDLAAKQRYADYAVTQLCFDADAICRFAAEARRRGIETPLVAGVPGAVDTGRLLRISLKVGVGDSLKFVRRNASAARQLLRPRGYRPDGLVRKLAARVRDGRCSVEGLHIYTFNQIGATVGWLQDARRTRRRLAA